LNDASAVGLPVGQAGTFLPLGEKHTQGLGWCAPEAEERHDMATDGFARNWAGRIESPQRVTQFGRGETVRSLKVENDSSNVLP
jgi:hypothetical protein